MLEPRSSRGFDREDCFVESTGGAQINVSGSLRLQRVVMHERGRQAQANAMPIGADCRKEWNAAKERCGEKCLEIAQRRATGIDNCQESQASVASGRSRLSVARHPSGWTLELCAFRPPSHLSLVH